MSAYNGIPNSGHLKVILPLSPAPPLITTSLFK